MITIVMSIQHNLQNMSIISSGVHCLYVGVGMVERETIFMVRKVDG